MYSIHRRKLLHHQHHSTMANYATNCRPEPSPSPSPLQSSLSQHFPPKFTTLPSIITTFYTGINHDHSHALRVAAIVMACLVGILVFICSMSIIRRKYYNSRRHNQNRTNDLLPILFDLNGDSPVLENDDEGPVIDHPIWFIRTVGLPQSVIDSITVFTYRKNEGVLIDGAECSVCLGEFQEEESLRLLPKCSHAFHIPCIDTWLRSHKNCPMCRAPVVRDDAEVRASTEPYSNVSGVNHETQMENFDSGSIGLMRIGDDEHGASSSEDGGESESTTDKSLSNFDDKMKKCLGSNEVEEEDSRWG